MKNAVKRLGAVRVIYVVMYSAAAVYNTQLAFRRPEVLRGVASEAFFPFLRHIFSVAPEIAFTLGLLSFAAYQLTLVALLVSHRHYRLGLLGGIVFHIGILPFGAYNLINLFIVTPLVVKMLAERRQFKLSPA